MLESIRDKNKGLQIFSVFDSQFSEFGKILTGSEFVDSIKYIKNHTDIPDQGNIYVANDLDFIRSLQNNRMFDDVFGGIPLQYGYCNGQNTKLNALEYHKSSEINIAVTPLILLLGLTKDIINNQYDTNNVKAFFVPENTVFEIFPKVLHFAPCKVIESGFKCAVILPLGTNTEFVLPNNYLDNESKYLLKTNKWLLAHNGCKRMIDQGAYVGIIGENIEVIF